MIIELFSTGGDSTFFIHSIEQYDLFLSVFDLAVIWFVTCGVYFILILYTEKAFILTLDLGYNTVLASRLKWGILFIRFIALGTWAFSVTKGSLVLRDFLKNDTYPGMCAEYYASLIFSVVASTIMFLLSLIVWKGLKMVEKQRVKKFYNSKLEEVDKDGKLVPTEASMLRLAALAKPVS